MYHSRTILDGVAALGAVLLLLCTLLVFTSVGGYKAQVVLSDSMKPVFSTGSLIIVHALPPWQYRRGDIVSFAPPIKNGGSITHRITRLYTSGGVPVMETKGDANRSADSWITSLGAITGKEFLEIPFLGYPIQLLKTPLGFIFTAFLLFILLVWREVVGIVLFFRPTSVIPTDAIIP